MCGPSKKLLYCVGFMSLISTVAFIVAMTTPQMITNKTDFPFDYTIRQNRGLWRGCVKTTGPSDSQNNDNCQDFKTDECDLLPPHNAQNGDNCDKFKTVKSFAILAVCFSGGSCLFLVVLAFMSSCRAIPYILTFLAVAASTAFGIVSSSIYIELAKYDVEHNGWEYGYSMGLFLAAWCMNALVVLVGLLTGAACGRTP